MSIDRVKRYLGQWGKAGEVREFEVSSATVELAALALGVDGSRIAKTISFQGPALAGADGEDAPDLPAILIVAAGDAKIDNGKFRQRFGVKARMLSPEDTLAVTGHAVGGVCPFAVDNPGAEIYLDVSLQRFITVFPACGSSHSCIELSCEELYEMSRARDWVDVCKGWS